LPLAGAALAPILARCHWEPPVCPRRGGHVLNVDDRVVVLTT
jgi:hypothetical protein